MEQSKKKYPCSHHRGLPIKQSDGSNPKQPSSAKKEYVDMAKRKSIKWGLLGGLVLSSAGIMTHLANQGSRFLAGSALQNFGEQGNTLEETYQNFNAFEAHVLQNLARAFAFPDKGDMPDPADTRFLILLDDFLNHISHRDRRDLKALILVLEYGPTIFDFWKFKTKSFTELTLDEQRIYLRGWANSPLSFRRMAIQVAKSMVMLSYWSIDDVYKSIEYDGPWVGRIEVEAYDPPLLATYSSTEEFYQNHPLE